MTLFARTAHTTRCPYKGEANYYSLKVGDRTAANAVWTYETPHGQVAAIKGIWPSTPTRWMPSRRSPPRRGRLRARVALGFARAAW